MTFYPESVLTFDLYAINMHMNKDQRIQRNRLWNSSEFATKTRDVLGQSQENLRRENLPNGPESKGRKQNLSKL